MTDLALFLGLFAIIAFGVYIVWRYLGKPLTQEQTELMESEIARHNADVTMINSAMSSSSDPK